MAALRQDAPTPRSLAQDTRFNALPCGLSLVILTLALVLARKRTVTITVLSRCGRLLLAFAFVARVVILVVVRILVVLGSLKLSRQQL